jgi:deoxyadenosine/deoxycytidine kinase
LIAFEGILGAGKTTLARGLAAHIGGQVLEEDLSACPFLTDFYQEPTRYAPQTEFSFLLLHYHQLCKLDSAARTVADFTLAKDVVFARCNLNSSFLTCFEELYTLLSAELPIPDVCVHVRINPELALQRIRSRGRAAESLITCEYLIRLGAFYDAHLPRLLPNVVIVDVEAFDEPDTILAKLVPRLAAHLPFPPRSAGSQSV